MIKSFLTYLPSVLLSRLSAFILVVVGARLMEPEPFGYLFLIIAIGLIADVSVTNWTRIATARFGASHAGVPRAFAVKMLGLTALCAIAAIAFSGGIAEFLAPETSGRLALAVMAYVLAATLFRYGYTLHQVAGNHRRASILEAIRAVLMFGLSIAAMLQTGDYFYVSLASSGVGIFLGTIAVVSGIRGTKSGLKDTTPTATLIKFAVPLIVIALLSQLISNADKAMLKIFHDAATLALSAAAFTMGRTIFDVIATAFNSGAFPRLSALFNAGNRQETDKLLSNQMAQILAVALPTAGVLIASRGIVAKVFFPPEYLDPFMTAIPLVTLGAIALNMKNFVFDNIFHLYLKNMLQIPVLLAGAATSLAVGFVILPVTPILGAATMFAAGALVSLLADICFTRHLMRVTIPWRSLLASAGIGLFGWVLCSLLIAVLGGVIPNWTTLVILIGVGTAAAGTSLLLAHVAQNDAIGTVAFSYITVRPNNLTGLSSYAESLIKAVADQQDGPRLLFFTNAKSTALPALSAHPNIKWMALPDRAIIPYKLYVLFAHQAANIMAVLKGSRVYVSTTATAAPFPIARQYFTLHDLYDLDHKFRPLRTILFARCIWWWLSRVSKKVICVSHMTRNDALASLLFPAAKLCVIKEASKFAPEARDADLQRTKFLFVANVQNTKNVECLLEALKRSEKSGLFEVTWIGNDRRAIAANWMQKNGSPAGLHSAGVVSDTQLQDAYRQAIALIVPSWREGFCLPVLEAHAFGTPVIASDIPILREVAADGALYFDPHDPDALVRCMHKVHSDAALRDQLCDAAVRNARKYSWTISAGEVLNLIGART